MRLLYDGLPEQAKAQFQVGKQVHNITADTAGVHVACMDGSTYRGTIAIGADGVNSKVRALMSELGSVSLGVAEEAGGVEKCPFISSYVCMWASIARRSPANLIYEVQAKDKSIISLQGRDMTTLYLFKKLHARTDKRVRYDVEDIRRYAKEFSGWYIDETHKVSDVLSHDCPAGMMNLEEGVLDKWSWGGRLVLVGDACHKFTINAGLGFNSALQDVVALSNGLHQYVSGLSKNGQCNETSAIQGVFHEYQNTRLKTVKEEFSQSWHATRLEAWSTHIYSFIAQFLLSWNFIQVLLTNYRASPKIRKSLVLDYIPTNELIKGKLDWAYPLSIKATREN